MTKQTIDGVPREFVREGRYIVVKPDYEDDIRTERLRNYIEEMCFHTPDCVVVEADWPEYEPVRRMIEARVIGNPTELDAAKATISQLQGLVAELRALLDAPADTRTETVPKHKFDTLVQHCKRLEGDIAHARAHVNEITLYQQNAVWFWQNDGGDFLESLSCPIIIQPHHLRELLKGVAPAAQPQGEPVALTPPARAHGGVDRRGVDQLTSMGYNAPHDKGNF